MHQRKLLVTHHAPDLDAIGSVWMLKRFVAQDYADSRITFVNPGETLSITEGQRIGYEPHEVTHVDTGLGEFDHHQTDRGQQHLSATLLTYQYACELHPELKNDKALEYLTNFVTDIDHFQEVNWPEAGELRYSFMIHELIKGMEFQTNNTDEIQLHFGMTCLDSAYAVLTNNLKAEEILATASNSFEIHAGKVLAVETGNDDTIKLAQKKGYVLVIRKDPSEGNIRIKARPDADISLEALRDAIYEKDSQGSWYYHPSGKMLINGSRKHRNQKASSLSLAEVEQLVKELYS